MSTPCTFQQRIAWNWWKMRQTLLLPSNWKPGIDCQLAYLYLFLANSKGQGQGRELIETVNISEMVKDRTNITIAIKLEVTYDLSIDIFTYYLDTFYRSRDGYAKIRRKFLEIVTDRSKHSNCHQIPNICGNILMWFYQF